MVQTGSAYEGSSLLPMASPPRPLSIALASQDLVVASLNQALDGTEQVETATQFRFGITHTRFLADVEGKSAEVTGPHMVRFHEKGDKIRSRISGRLQSTWVVISSAMLEDIASTTPDWRRPFQTPFTQPTLATLARFHRFLNATRKSADALQAQESLIELLPELMAPHIAHNIPPVRTSMQRLSKQAGEILARDFAKIKSLRELARKLNISTSYLCRAYRISTGNTLHATITRLRISHALSRLAEGTTDLTALALELGYASHSHFCTEFRRYVGQPPSAFRLSTQL